MKILLVLRWIHGENKPYYKVERVFRDLSFSVFVRLIEILLVRI